MTSFTLLYRYPSVAEGSCRLMGVCLLRHRGGQQSQELGRGERTAIEIALQVVDVAFCQEVSLLLGFDPFGDGFQSQAGGQTDGAVKNMAREGIGTYHGDEALVDLEVVHVNLLQI